MRLDVFMKFSICAIIDAHFNLSFMIIINEEKWQDIKNDFIKSIDYKFSEVPLIYFNHKNNREEEIGRRETYEFSKNDIDYMIVLDVEHRLNKSTSEKDGKLKENYSRSKEDFTYKLSIKFQDKDGSWKDSSALESNFE